jgi:diadenosine tetraphosphate (Ap4A) HIT family hydrolase
MLAGARLPPPGGAPISIKDRHLDKFLLDPRLAADSTFVADLGLSDLRLMNDARFAWLLLVPRRPGLAEIIELPKPERARLFEEIVAVMAALKAATQCDKLNVAALGNQVRQLHVHVIGRFRADSAWPNPVWGTGAAVAYDDETRDKLIADLSGALSP